MTVLHVLSYSALKFEIRIMLNKKSLVPSLPEVLDPFSVILNIFEKVTQSY